MVIIKRERDNGFPEEIDDGLYLFDEGKWLNKCEIVINGETREFFCVYESSRRVLLSVTLGESISMDETGTLFAIHGWKIEVDQNETYDLSTLLDPRTAANYEFKTLNHIIPSSFIAEAAIIREIQKFYGRCISGKNSRAKK